MGRPLGLRCTKGFLIAFNLIFLVFGFAVLAVGIWMAVDQYTFIFLRLTKCTPSESLFNTVPYLFIGIGSFVVVVTFLSCCGAFAESTCFLCLYAMMVILVLLAEIVVSILFFEVFQNKIFFSLHQSMKQQIHSCYNYSASSANGTDALTLAWDTMQAKLKCCGAVGPKDYEFSAWFNRTRDNEGMFVPRSCCVLEGGASADPKNLKPVDLNQCQIEAFLHPRHEKPPQYLKTKGCTRSLRLWLGDNKGIVVGILVASMVVQTGVVVLACVIMWQIRSHETDYDWVNSNDEFEMDTKPSKLNKEPTAPPTELYD